jgi:hypothetical protein
MALANPPGDHLRELRAEIQDDNLFHRRKLRSHGVPPPRQISERKISSAFQRQGRWRRILSRSGEEGRFFLSCRGGDSPLKIPHAEGRQL